MDAEVSGVWGSGVGGVLSGAMPVFAAASVLRGASGLVGGALAASVSGAGVFSGLGGGESAGGFCWAHPVSRKAVSRSILEAV